MRLYWLLILVIAVTNGDPWVCSDKVARQILKTLPDYGAATRCPEASWKEMFLRSKTIQGSPAAVTIFDIGCNKGFDALSSLNLFSQNWTIGKDLWRKETGFPCGACQQCSEEAHRTDPAAAPKKVELYCAEPMPATFMHLNASAIKLGLLQRGLHVVHGAFTNLQHAEEQHWMAYFPAPVASLSGWEAMGLIDTGKGPRYEYRGPRRHVQAQPNRTYPVPLYVLDNFTTAQGVRHIDILSIDTEGFDPLVLQGARAILHNTRYLEFEYHKIGPWFRHPLKAVLRQLEDVGFVCYWIGQQKLWRITGCFHPRYERHVWSNIGCVQQRETEWYAIMEDVFNQTVSR